MHRTEGEDYKLEGGKRMFAPAIPPSQKATRLPAESMNSIQEEICNVIEHAGLTLEPDSNADRTGGWLQLWKAITDCGIIVTNAIANLAVTTEKIADKAVTTAKIGDYEIKSINIDSQAVTNEKIALGEITGNRIANYTIDEINMGNDSINSSAIKSEAVQSAHIFPKSVDASKIADDTITLEKMADDSVDLAKLTIPVFVGYRTTSNIGGVVSVNPVTGTLYKVTSPAYGSDVTILGNGLPSMTFFVYAESYDCRIIFENLLGNQKTITLAQSQLALVFKCGLGFAVMPLPSQV